jgi:hypothetical protein
MRTIACSVVIAIAVLASSANVRGAPNDNRIEVTESWVDGYESSSGSAPIHAVAILKNTSEDFLSSVLVRAEIFYNSVALTTVSRSPAKAYLGPGEVTAVYVSTSDAAGSLANRVRWTVTADTAPPDSFDELSAPEISIAGKGRLGFDGDRDAYWIEIKNVDNRFADPYCDGFWCRPFNPVTVFYKDGKIVGADTLDPYPQGAAPAGQSVFAILETDRFLEVDQVKTFVDPRPLPDGAAPIEFGIENIVWGVSEEIGTTVLKSSYEIVHRGRQEGRASAVAIARKDRQVVGIMACLLFDPIPAGGKHACENTTFEGFDLGVDPEAVTSLSVQVSSQDRDLPAPSVTATPPPTAIPTAPPTATPIPLDWRRIHMPSLYKP